MILPLGLGEPSGLMVENMSKNPNFKGSNPTTDTNKEKFLKKAFNKVVSW
jgi:hypothetical protein